MDSILYYTMLFDTYGELLTEKQKNYFQEYYFLNLSLAEIAEKYKVSRNAIHNLLKDTKNILEHYETVLHLVEKQDKLRKIEEMIPDEKIKKQLEEIIEK